MFKSIINIYDASDVTHTILFYIYSLYPKFTFQGPDFSKKEVFNVTVFLLGEVSTNKKREIAESLILNFI